MIGTPNPITQKLITAGIIPPNCSKATLRMPANDVVTLELEVFVSERQFLVIAEALTEDPERAKRIARKVIFRCREHDEYTVHLDLEGE